MTGQPGVQVAGGVGFDVDRVREEFPILRQEARGRPLVYLDNAATTQKPRAVIDAVRRYYESDNANVHRGVHLLSERATAAYEQARIGVQRFLNAAEAREIVFTRGTTEAVNLVAHSYGRSHVGRDDEILISAMEHHSNIVPWQMLCEETGARLRVIPMTDRGELIVEELERLVSDRTRLVAVVHLSNAVGTVNPVREIVTTAHRRGVPVLVDGAQALSHLAVDVQALDCDFYVGSGHKMYGPTGIGFLYAKAALLEAMRPYQGGGDMISSVTFEKTEYNVIPYKFEAGTPNIAGAIGLGAAVDYLAALDRGQVMRHEEDLVTYAAAALGEVPGLRFVGEAASRAALVSFVMDDVHPHDIGTIVDRLGVAIRTGHHCCQPLMSRLGVPATARASFALYNTRAEVDTLQAALLEVRRMFD